MPSIFVVPHSPACDAAKNNLPFDGATGEYAVPFTPNPNAHSDKLYVAITCGIPSTPARVNVKYVLTIQNIMDYAFVLFNDPTTIVGNGQTKTTTIQTSHNKTEYIEVRLRSLRPVLGPAVIMIEVSDTIVPPTNTTNDNVRIMPH